MPFNILIQSSMKSKEPKQEMKQFFINPAVVAEWAKVLPQIQVDAHQGPSFESRLGHENVYMVL